MYATKSFVLVLAAGLLVSTGAASGQTPMGTAFTYQGYLERIGFPVNHTCDFEFTLWDDDTFGTQKGPTQTFWSEQVDVGHFTVPLDFGSGVFNGNARWLEIGVHCPGDPPGFTTLSPRQELTPTSYAIYAETSGSVVDGITGNGTPNYIAKWKTESELTESVIYEDPGSGNIGIGTDAPLAHLDIRERPDPHHIYLGIGINVVDPHLQIVQNVFDDNGEIHVTRGDGKKGSSGNFGAQIPGGS